jgi:hypothetical protein
MFLVAAFRVSLKWGLLVLLVPFAGLVFVFAHWTEAKRGFLISLAGGVLCPIAGFMLVSGAMAGMGEQMAEQMAQQMEQEMARQMEQANAQQQGTSSVSMTEIDTAPAASGSPDEVASTYGTIETRSTGAAERHGSAEPAGGPIPLNPLDSLPDGSESDGEDGGVARVSIPVRSAHSHIGERLEFVRTDGRIFRAELVAVDGGRLRIKRDVPGGTMVYPVPRSEIAKLRSSP